MLKFKVNGEVKKTYKELQVIGDTFEVSDGRFTVLCNEAINTGIDDKFHFFYENWSESFYDTRTILEEDANFGYIVDTFGKVFRYIEETETKDGVKMTPLATPKSFLRVVLSDRHYSFLEEPINIKFVDENGYYGGKCCAGDYVLYGSFLLKINDVTEGGEYDYTTSEVMNEIIYLTYYDSEDVAHYVPAYTVFAQNGTIIKNELYVDYDNQDVFVLQRRDYTRLYVDDLRFFTRASNPPYDDVSLVKRSATTICLENGGIRLFLPLGESFATNMIGDELLLESIEEDAYRRIPDPIDYEKRTFVPVSKDGKDIEKIQFNLHFRDRFIEDGNGDVVMAEDWIAKDEAYWFNYPKIENGRLVPEKYTSAKGGVKSDVPVNYSDLLGYLGFMDEDVKYQKKKITNSFLRISFYDSPDRRTQQLLYTTKLYLNSGELYRKYSYQKQNSDIIGDEAEVLEYNSVFFEPYDDFSTYRLSSMFECTNKNDIYHTTDGFYLHLFLGNLKERPEGGVIYMKAEFNNSKYGYRIPLTLPVDDNNVPIGPTDTKFPISYMVVDPSGRTSVNMSRLSSDSYATIRIKYDEENGRCLWFHDGIEVGDDNILIFNLFEPRINGFEIQQQS